MDPHKNIFYFYRGQTRKDKTDFSIEDKQIENNLTKALINVLDPENLNINLANGSDLAEELFSEIMKNKVGKLEKIRLQEKLETKKIPDAILSFENAIIGIEAKFGAKIEADQLNEELDGLNGEYSSKSVVLVVIAPLDQIDEHTDLWKNKNFMPFSWQQIYGFFESKVQDIKKPEQIFLLKQYLEYMRLMHMSEKFTREDFESIGSDGKLDKNLCKSFDKFTKQVLEVLKQESHYLDEFEITKNTSATENRPWILLVKKGKPPTKARHELHFTLHINNEGIDINLNAEGHELPQELAKAVLNDFNKFEKLILKLTKEIPKNEMNAKPGFRVYSDGTIYFGSGNRGEDPLWHNEICLIDKERENHSKSRKFRSSAIKDLLQQISEIARSDAPYLYLRISYFMPKTKIFSNNKNLTEQAKLFGEEAKDIVLIYKYFNKLLEG